jgi:hypothetical protein
VEVAWVVVEGSSVGTIEGASAASMMTVVVDPVGDSAESGAATTTVRVDVAAWLNWSVAMVSVASAMREGVDGDSVLLVESATEFVANGAENAEHRGVVILAPTRSAFL